MDVTTKAIHGAPTDTRTGAIAPILSLSKAFRQTPGVKPTFEYGRGQTPTTAHLEATLVGIEKGAKHCVVFSSGLAAEDAFFTNLLLQSEGSPHVLLHHELYGGTVRLLERILSRFGIRFTLVDFSQPDKVRAAVTPETKYLFIETPTNPKLSVVDLNAVRALSKELGVPFAVDNTFATPVLTNPIGDYGAAVVIHSLSKYISGHNDTVAGAILCTDAVLYEQLCFLRRAKGAVLAPESAYRVLQGAKTLDLRIRRQSESALCIARLLANDPNIEHVYYPGLTTYPNHRVATSQMRGLYGGVVTFVIRGDESTVNAFIAGATAAIDGTEVIIYSESLGATETLLSCPFFMSHAGLSPEERAHQRITPNLLRLSCGLESVEDIYRALEQGLRCIASAKTTVSTQTSGETTTVALCEDELVVD